MTSIQPELWVDRAGTAVAFYQAAFGASVMHSVGDGDDIVAQLGVGDAAFWVTAASSSMKRFSPKAIDGTTSRTLLVVENPEQVWRRRYWPGRPRRHLSATSTAGVLGGSSIHSATSGKSANLWALGRQRDLSSWKLPPFGAWRPS